MDKSQMHKKVGEFMRVAREAAGLTQAGAAKSLGYSTPQFVSNWERGLCNPPHSELKKLCKLYKLEREDLAKIWLGFYELAFRKGLGLK